MHCNTLIDPVCRAVGHLVQTATGSVAGDVLGGIAQAISGGVRWIVENTATWWVRIPSPNLATEPAVTHLRQWLLPVTVAVAVGAVIAAGARMAIMRRANPLLDVTGGLVTLAAAGSIAPMTRPWIRKVTSWMLALIFYKPAAAAVYAAAFTMIGSGRSARTVLMGFVTLLLSVLMLPALMKIFTWTTGSI